MYRSNDPLQYIKYGGNLTTLQNFASLIRSSSLSVMWTKSLDTNENVLIKIRFCLLLLLFQIMMLV